MTASCVRLGLTGGIGSGKSTVARMLVNRGAALIDADAISRCCSASGGAAIEAIRSSFGAQYIDSTGAMDRGRIRELVFRDDAARKKLEAIVHPIVQGAMNQQEAAARAAGYPVLVLDIPLLVEAGHWTSKFDSVWVVDCCIATQIERVAQRSGMARVQIEAIIASQVTRLQRRRAADAVVCNEQLSLAALEAAVGALAKTLGL